MNREVHVRFCEGLGVQLPWSTHPFREDDSRSRDKVATRSFALLSKMALTIVKNDKSNKFSLRGRRKNAGWSNAYMAHLLFGCVKKPVSAENSFNA
jgi:hypothetical protein